MKNENDISLISIGGLARACGVPVETLRNWERRYGFPVPSRLDSGHRRYPWNIVPRLRNIRRALSLGYKPSFAVGATTEQLEEIISETEPASSDEVRGFDPDAQRDLDSWMEAVEKLDSAKLGTAVRRSWSRVGARRFLIELVVPFLREVGDRWETGELSVAHEHFASEVLQSFIASQWRPLAPRGGAGRVVLANFEGELHGIGLHICAVFLVLKDFEPLFLGPNTPTEDILAASKQARVKATVIGFSSVYDSDKASKALGDLAADLPAGVSLVYGGNEDVPRVDGARFMESFEEFDLWVTRVLAGEGE